MWRTLFESALRWAVYPKTCGSSGMVDRYLSSRLLNMSTLQPVMFLISLGRVLKSCWPRTGRVACFRAWIFLGEWWLIHGIWHSLPRLMCQIDLTFALPPSAISFSWRHLYLSFVHGRTISTSSLRNSVIGYMCASFQMSTFLTWSSLVFPLAHRSMRISVVCNFLSSFFLTAQPGRFYSRLVHFVFQLCWYVPVAHHPSSFPPLWPGNLYSVVYIFLCSSVGIKHWAQILERFHCLHFFFLNVDSLVSFWTWHILCFSSAYS